MEATQKEEKRYKCNAWMRKKEGEGKDIFEGILANAPGTYGGCLFVETSFLHFCWMVKPTCKIDTYPICTYSTFEALLEI